MLKKDMARRISASLDLAEKTSANLFKSVGRKRVSAKKVQASAKKLANIGKMAENKIIASMNGKSDILKASGIKAIENLHSRALAIQAQSKLILKANEEYLEDEVIEAEDEFDGLEEERVEVEAEDEFEDLDEEEDIVEAEDEDEMIIEDEIVEAEDEDDSIGEEDIFEEDIVEAEDEDDVIIEDEIQARKKAKSVRAKSAKKRVSASNKNSANPYGKGFWSFGK